MVVVTWRGREHIAKCLNALAGQDRPHRTLVVDNASDDGTAAILAGHPGRADVLRLRENRGYAGGLAAALTEVDTEYVAWLNDDAAPESGWLAALESALDDHPDVAAVTARLVRPDGSTQSVGVRITAGGYGADLLDGDRAAGSASGGEVFGFCGGAALLRTAELRAVGGVPAGFFCYYEDTDTAWRLRLHGWRVRSAPDAVVTHLHGATTKPGSTAFHRWNERNRLLTLIRCAPLGVAARELARFAAITTLLPLRRATAGAAAANFRVRLRIGVLGEVVGRLPWSWRERRQIGRSAASSRDDVWREWAGR